MSDAMRRPFEAASAEMLLGWGGQAGVDVFDDTDVHTGVWCKIVAKGAVVINDLIGNWYDDAGAVVSIAALADGEAIYGKFTSIDLTSGTVYCHRAIVGE